MIISLAQINPTVGAITANADKIAAVFRSVASSGCELVIFPELSLTGYPPKDILERPWVINNVLGAIARLEKESAGHPECGLLVGAPIPTGMSSGKGLYNSALLIYQGKTVFTQAKTLLPNYDVFDETRYFDQNRCYDNFNFRGTSLGITICEDAWFHSAGLFNKKIYDVDPVQLAAMKADLLINIASSPFTSGKEKVRFQLFSEHAARHRVPFIYVNQVGGNDELIFDGGSMFIDSAGKSRLQLPCFEESIQRLDTDNPGTVKEQEPQEQIKSVHDALVLGVKDYFSKTGFKKAVLGLSGGIDSALVCCLAVEALSAENVLGITMPSQYSSAGSIEDSRKLALNLGIEFKIIPIKAVFDKNLEILTPHFRNMQPDLTEENLQARIRGNFLMAFSNKFNSILLSTGNKSEMAVGYCTLYGDMNGGLAVIADVPKTMIYRIAEYLNRGREIIPKATIEKAPSAELRPNQTDQDTLPPYPVLDAILHHYIEENLSYQEIVGKGFAPDTVAWVIKAIEKNEYKRRQAPLCLKVTSKSFGAGRRFPIAAVNEYK
ncbi:MAG: NAD+ synthase [Candidatus Wallbacteria bacterium]|nr:NAD+ synthase [Candidatus Wallbacteria bacterium]